MKCSLLETLSMFCTFLLVCGCDVHQWPELTPEPIIEEIPNEAVLRLHFEPDFWVWEHLYDPKTGVLEEQYPDFAVDEDHPGTTSRYNAECSQGLMRILIRAFRPGNMDDCLREYTFVRGLEGGYDCTLTLDIPHGDYVLAVWADLYEHPENASHYNPGDFRRLMLLFEEGHKANTDYRDGYRGRTSVTIPSSDGTEQMAEHYDVVMRRPMGKLEIVTTDLSEFLDRETTRRTLSSRASVADYRVVISYPAYYPYSYSVIEDRLENSITGINFETQMTVTGESEASLGFDYVFINDTKIGGVSTEVSVYDMTGERVAHSRSINIPLRRNHHTVLRGAFLTTNAMGGVGIDPGYDGEHNVVVP